MLEFSSSLSLNLRWCETRKEQTLIKRTLELVLITAQVNRQPAQPVRLPIIVFHANDRLCPFHKARHVDERVSQYLECNDLHLPGVG